MCVPAAQPDAEVCSRSASQKRVRSFDAAEPRQALKPRPRDLDAHLGLRVDPRLIFQQEICHLDVAIVTGHVERRVAQLTTKKISLTRRSGENVGSGVEPGVTGCFTLVSGSRVAPWLTRTSATLTLSSWAARWSGVRPDWGQTERRS